MLVFECCSRTRPAANSAEERPNAAAAGGGHARNRAGTGGNGGEDAGANAGGNAETAPGRADGGAADGARSGHGGGNALPPAANAGAAAASGRSTDSSAGAAGGPDAAPAPAYVVTTCDELAATSGCVVAPGDSALVLRGDVLTPGAVYLGGGVRVEGDVITCVGCDCAAASATLVSCAGAVIAPGLVNPHDHIAYDGVGPSPLGSERYDHRHDWRLGLRGHTELAYRGGASSLERAAQEIRLLLGGATTVAGGAGAKGLLRNADMPDLGEGLPTAPADSETFPLDDADGFLLASGCNYGKNHATPDDVARAGAFLGHLGEGVDADAENELDCALTPDFGLLGPTSGAVHAVATTAALAAELGARSSLVVWSPRSNVALYGNTAPVPLLLRSGVEVALGTDWLLTGSMNLLRELDCAKRWSETYFDHALDDHALFSMVTVAAAHAVGAGDAVGRLAPGMLADIAIVERREREPFNALVSAEPADFSLILRAGTPLYGDEAVLDALGGNGCDELVVCGSPKRVCTGDSGFTLAELRAVADATYPLFSCDEPPNEPSCVPARPGEYEGIPSDGDRDGDGVPDGDDRCPDVFDPPRPLDDGVEPDSDGDGRGDACDPCPLDGDDVCRARLGDRDADGVPDGIDSCPALSNPDQADRDDDGRGDACDFCTAENAGISPCPLAIAALRNHEAAEHPPRQALIELDGALVTALRPDTGSSRGFYVEDAAEPYSGLFVYTGSDSPGVEVGDRVSLRGRYDVYYDFDELVGVTLLSREPSGSAPMPIAVAAQSIGDGGELADAYDSMLVTITDAIVVETNPDAPSDYDETLLDGALRLDDLLDPALDNVFPTGSSFTRVTGILGYSFDHRKLMPRGPEDLVQ
jgi:hypothetical protein